MEINSNKDGEMKDKNAQHNNFDIDDITCITFPTIIYFYFYFFSILYNFYK